MNILLQATLSLKYEHVRMTFFGHFITCTMLWNTSFHIAYLWNFPIHFIPVVSNS